MFREEPAGICMKYTPAKPLLSDREIKRKLHLFNLNNDYSVFKDVPESQQVSVMYPSVIRGLGQTDEQYRQELIRLFGPLECN